MPGVDTAIGAGLGLVQSAVGLVKSGQSKRELDKLNSSRPKLGASQLNKNQLSLAESELSNGMSAGAKNAYDQGIDRDLSTSLDAVLRGGGSVNNISEVFDKSQQGRQRLAMMQDNLRLSQINNLVRAQDTSEDERKQLFQYNEYAPWADKMKAATSAADKAENMIWSGLNTAGGAIAGGIANDRAQSQYEDYFNNSGGQLPAQSPVMRSSPVQKVQNYTQPVQSTIFNNPGYDQSLFQ